MENLCKQEKLLSYEKSRNGSLINEIFSSYEIFPITLTGRGVKITSVTFCVVSRRQRKSGDLNIKNSISPDTVMLIVLCVVTAQLTLQNINNSFLRPDHMVCLVLR